MEVSSLGLGDSIIYYQDYLTNNSNVYVYGYSVCVCGFIWSEKLIS